MLRPAGSSSPRTLDARLWLGAIGSILILLSFASCGRQSGPRWNVVLISIDTLRSDHLGCDGYSRDTTPNLDAFCRQSVVFRQAIAQAPSTLPSHASIMSSLIPQQHGASFANRRPLAESFTTLPEVLHDAGYQTTSFNGGGQISRVWGLNQGFDRYTSLDEHSFAEVVGRGLQWLDDDRDPERPFFLFLHSFEVHHPYTPSRKDLERFIDPARIKESWVGPSVEVKELKQINRRVHLASEADKDVIVAAYDAEIRSMDRAFGKLLAGLNARHLTKETLLVFTSDHGEEFGEHGWWGWHAHTVYDELLRVPLIVHFPTGNEAGRVVTQQVRSIDIAPTVLDALDLRSPDEFSGKSLMPLVRGERMPPLLAVSMRDQPDEQMLLQSARMDRWKMIGQALYDLQLDPGESGRWLVNEPEVYLRLEKVLDHAAALARNQRKGNVPLDEGTRNRLEALGYL